MSTQGLLLRLLLCLTLILNGSGFAVAGSQMHMQHAPGTSMAETSARSVAHADCIEDSSTTSAAGDVSAATIHDPALADCCSDSEPCNQFMCAIACAAGMSAPATLPGLALGFQPAPQALNAVSPSAGHPDPALRSRYRPPIA
ncbi:CopL family metal-binding regulatory protein [Dokdonella sp.]|uniref:CopL family metal-binding regulatory protein n=1 Tax=Dokdonella sp. TaxID=2291710 RepID=UPI0039C873D1